MRVVVQHWRYRHHVIVYVVVRRWRRWYAHVNRALARASYPVELAIVEACYCGTPADFASTTDLKFYWCRVCGAFKA